jgi:alpha-1,6-mannosyltransferase
VRRGAIFALAGAGFLLAGTVVVAWGRLGPEPGSRNPTRWLGLLAVLTPDDASKGHLLFLLVPALLLLTACWWQVLRLAAQRRLTTRATAFLAACWALPFTVGPIIGSRDAYAYVAQGELARRGFDPTRAVVSQLPAGPLLAAVDPRWRNTRPPYGGVAVALQKAAAAAGSPTAALIVLRVLAVVAVLVMVIVTARMASPTQRPLVIVAIAANPLVLIHLVAGAHLDAVAAAFLVCGLAVARKQASALVSRSRPAHNATRARSQALVSRSRESIGVTLCTLGAMVKLPVGLGAVYLLVCGVVAAGPTLAARLRCVGADLLGVAAGVGLSVLVSGAGLGWLRNFGTPGRVRTGIAPADLLAHVISGFGVGHGVGLSAARIVAAVAGVALVAFLLMPRLPKIGSGQATGGRRGWTAPRLDQLGLAVLALALLGPVLYPWYLAPALPLLALAASHDPGGRLSPTAARRVILVASILLTAAAVPTLSPAWHALG